jgi:hypothetical protein
MPGLPLIAEMGHRVHFDAMGHLGSRHDATSKFKLVERSILLV